MLICYTNDYETNELLKDFLEKIDKLGCSIHLFTNFELHDTLIPDILHEVDIIYSELGEETQISFITDNKELFILVYRLLQDVFDDFIYLSSSKNILTEDSTFYKKFLESPIYPEEKLKIPYSNCTNFEINNISVPCLELKYYGNKNNENSSVKIKRYQRYYYIDGIYYVFQPVEIQCEKKYIYLDKKEENTIQKSENTCYYYYHNGELITEFIKEINILDYPKLTVSFAEKANALMDVVKRSLPYEQKLIQRILLDMDYYSEDSFIYRKIFIYHMFLNTFYNSHYNELLLEATLESKQLTYINKYFIWNQIKRLGTLFSAIHSKKTGQLMKEIYTHISNQLFEKFKTDLTRIPKEERNENLVIVITVQMLEDRHAPTHSVLERCYSLMSTLGKKVVLINTREFCSFAGAVPIYDVNKPGFMEEYNNQELIQYKDAKIPFYQIPVPTPNETAIADILGFMKREKPYYIISIGNGSIIADLLGSIVPQLAMGVVFSSLPITRSIFSCIGRKVREEEWDSLEKEGYKKDNIIESTFTFELQPQKHKLSRRVYNIPEDKFILVVVGTRLDYDVTDEFLAYMEKTYDENTHLVFAGVFKTFDEVCRRHVGLREHSTFVGYCSDMLALMEICDLYVNPKRFGGGFSVIEAFYKGKPGVAINTGDVAVAAGKDFLVENYEEMVEQIKKYRYDREFYERMSQKAKDRTKVVLDGSEAMKEMVDKLKNNPLFW